MKVQFLSELLKRISNESPNLFKKLQLIFFSLAAIVVVLIFLQPLSLDLKGFGIYVNWNTVVVLLGFAGINMLPVKDNAVLKTDDNGEPNPSDDDGTGRPKDPK